MLILLEGTMAIKDFLKPHRSWEDGVGLLLGLTAANSPLTQVGGDCSAGVWGLARRFPIRL